MAAVSWIAVRTQVRGDSFAREAEDIQAKLPGRLSVIPSREMGGNQMGGEIFRPPAPGTDVAAIFSRLQNGNSILPEHAVAPFAEISSIWGAGLDDGVLVVGENQSRER